MRMTDVSILLEEIDDAEEMLKKNRYGLEKRSHAYARLLIKTMKIILLEHSPEEETLIEQRMAHYGEQRHQCYMKLTEKARKTHKPRSEAPFILVQGPSMLHYICQDHEALKANQYFVMKHIRNDPYDEANMLARKQQQESNTQGSLENLLDVQWLQENNEKLSRQYPGQMVVISGQEVVYSRLPDKQQEVVEEAKRLNAQGKAVLIHYFDPVVKG